jgi:2,4-didehydro-3-deoxy-L-rhamnonate hydrolase
VIRLGRGQLGDRDGLVVEHDGRVSWLDDLPGVPDRLDLAELIARWKELSPAIERAADGQLDSVEEGLSLLAPLMPPKLICVGANYASHNAEMLGEVRDPFPFAFLKPPTTAVVSDGAVVPLPAYANEVDYEAELALVMAGPGEVFGYTVLNDLSTRDWVPGTSPLGIDWLVSKCFDGSAPLGPWVTPRRFVPDPDDLRLRLWVNDELRQDASTSGMVFGVEQIVRHVSRVLTIEPGDVIATGTPDGVGAGRKPPVWLGAGDRIRIEIELLGVLETTIGPPRDPSSR